MSPIFLALALLSLAPAAHASPPTDAELKRTETELGKARQRSETLARRAQELEGEQRALQERLVELAAEIQRNERELTEAEEKLDILSRETQAKEQALAARKRELEAMVSTAIRLSAMPPEATVMMPEESGRIIDTARTISLMASSIRLEAARVSEEYEALTLLKAKVEQSYATLTETARTLASRKSEMDVQLKERQALFEATHRSREEEEKKAARLARKSEDMKALLASLEKMRAEKEAEEKAEEEKRKNKKKRSFAAAKGHIRAPVAGKLSQRYGTPGKGEKNKGIVLSARANAQVTAPFDGEVVFTGPFLNYGKMVILRHSDNFHTLLAGLSAIEVKSGQFLLEGETIGAMGEEEAAQLYLELRKDNQPVDPSAWIAGLAPQT